MTGLYEAAIEALCVREIDGRVVRPKIVASAATVRRAQDQIQALFARPLTQVFPPPGPDRHDSFFQGRFLRQKRRQDFTLGSLRKVGTRKSSCARRGLPLWAPPSARPDAGGHKNMENPR